MKTFFQKSIPHLLAVALFFVLSVVYFLPVVLENKDIEQGDIKNSMTWGQDSKEYHKRTGNYSYWSNAMFSGMPANYTYAPPVTNIFSNIGKILVLKNSNNFGLLFLYMLGFYIFLIAIGCRSPLAIVGALAYAFVSYNLIIIEAGHILKGLVMATMAPMIGGIMLVYQKKYLWGILITLIFTGLNVAWSHQQISYYLLLIILILAIVYFIYAVKEKTIKDFLKSSAVLLIVAALAVTPSLGKLIPTMDYTKDTMRGGAVLKNNAAGEKETAGLDLNYAFQWSYGKMETFTLLIPNFYGGASTYNLGENSEFYKALRQSGNGSIAKQYASHAPTYWGADEYKSFTSGPVYAGAIICFLFVLGLIIVKGKEKWWLLGGTILSLLLAWGRNAEIDFTFFLLGIEGLPIHIYIPNINVFFFEHLPLYNKFRTPEMSLIMANLTMTILAVLALKTIFDNVKTKNKEQRTKSAGADLKSVPKTQTNARITNSREQYQKPILISAGITGGICLFFAFFGGVLFNFSAPSDSNFPDWLVSALLADRKTMLVGDSWRSFFFIAIAAVLLIIYLKKSFKTNYLIFAIGLLIFIDLWAVDKRFLGNDKFVSKHQAKEFVQSDIDKMILQDTTHYRVLNLAGSTFNESATSAFHKSVGGYSPAKLRRYQDIIDYYFSKQLNQNILNMLNTKYIIFQTQEGNRVQINENAFGNAWFVDSIKWVNSPDEEILETGTADLKNVAVIDTAWRASTALNNRTPSKVEAQARNDRENNDTAAYIKLADYKNAGNMIFESLSDTEKFAVFSEVYYKTWKAYIDGEEVPLMQVNYILRGLQVPAGKHVIELKCKDELMIKWSQISLFASIFVGVVLMGLLGLIVWKKLRK